MNLLSPWIYIFSPPFFFYVSLFVSAMFNAIIGTLVTQPLQQIRVKLSGKNCFVSQQLFFAWVQSFFKIDDALKICESIFYSVTPESAFLKDRWLKVKCTT